ncbi:MAG: hypothetical protein EOO17_01230 [Chloroflexi bacterium]|nr:MAG: hypothetical protein EOO17_01230 [Chloroflexota bacterium]
MEHMIAAFAQFDNDNRGERSKEGLTRRRNEGGYPHRAPLGYDNYKDMLKRPTLRINDTGIVLSGLLKEFNQGSMTVRNFENRLADKEVVSVNGSRIGYTGAYSILTNPVYAGKIRSKHLLEPIEGLHDGLISDVEFETNQLIIEGRAVKFSSEPVDDWPLRGVLMCGNCGHSMTGSSSTGRSKRYPKYHCTRCRAKEVGHSVAVSRDDLHIQFVALLESIAPSNEQIVLFKEIFLKKWDAIHESAKAEREVISNESDRLLQRKRRVTTLFIDGEINRQEKEEQVHLINIELNKQRDALSKNHDNSIVIDDALTFGTNLMRDAAAVWDQGDLRTKRLLQSTIFPDGVRYNFVNGFGTVKTSEIYEVVRKSEHNNYNVVGLDGIEPSTKWL